MQDVARVANVSVSTVSAVINMKGIIGPELTEKVHEAIRLLRYVPHQEARGLRIGRSRIIGTIIPDVTNPFHVSVLRTIETEVMNRGYDAMICDSADQVEVERKHLSALHSRRVEGILLATADSFAARETALRSLVPIVFLDSVPSSSNVNCVITNNVDASREATQYLIGLGHKKIAMISRRPFQSTTIDRLEGYQKAMKEAGLPSREEFMEIDESEVEAAYQCAVRLLKSPEPPTAIFSLNNRVSLGLMQAVRGLAIPCPGRVSLIGFDDPDWAMVTSPPLTSIEQPTKEIGKRAVELLFRSIESAGSEGKMEPEQILLKSTLRIRESTGAPCSKS
jgi:LacI family transcriptional regulator